MYMYYMGFVLCRTSKLGLMLDHVLFIYVLQIVLHILFTSLWSTHCSTYIIISPEKSYIYGVENQL